MANPPDRSHDPQRQVGSTVIDSGSGASHGGDRCKFGSAHSWGSHDGQTFTCARCGRVEQDDD